MKPRSTRKVQRERLRQVRQQVKALAPVEPAAEGEEVMLLLGPDVPHDDPELCRLAAERGCNTVRTGTAAHTYHAAALLADHDLSQPVIYRHRHAPFVPEPVAREDLLERIEELERQIRAMAATLRL